MDKNSFRNTGHFLLLDGGWGIMTYIIPFLSAFLFSKKDNAIVAGIVSFLVCVLLVYIFFSIKWSNRKKEGFLNVGTDFQKDVCSEDIKFAKIIFSGKDELERIFLQLPIKRITFGYEYGDLFFDKQFFLAKDLELKDYPIEIPIFQIRDKFEYVVTNEELLKSIMLLDEKKSFSIDKCEIIFEANGKIDGKYTFSELYKCSIESECCTDEDIETSEGKYRSCKIKSMKIENWTYEKEQERDILKKMRSISDKDKGYFTPINET